MEFQSSNIKCQMPKMTNGFGYTASLPVSSFVVVNSYLEHDVVKRITIQSAQPYNDQRKTIFCIDICHYENSLDLFADISRSER